MRVFVIYANTFTEFLFVKRGIVCQETKIERSVRDWNYFWASVVTLFLHYPHALSSSVSVTCNIHSDGADIRFARISFHSQLFSITFIYAAGDISSNKYKFYIDENMWTWHEGKFRIKMSNIDVKEEEPTRSFLMFSLRYHFAPCSTDWFSRLSQFTLYVWSLTSIRENASRQLLSLSSSFFAITYLSSDISISSCITV